MKVTGWPTAAADWLAAGSCGSSVNMFDGAMDGRNCGAAGKISR